MTVSTNILCSGGMTELGCDSVDKLKSKLHSLDLEILDQNKFKESFIRYKGSISAFANLINDLRDRLSVCKIST